MAKKRYIITQLASLSSKATSEQQQIVMCSIPPVPDPPGLGLSHYKLHFCFTCQTDTNVVRKLVDQSISFVLEMYCSACSTRWFICTLCPSVRAHYKMPKQILRHTKKLHSREHAYLKELYDLVNDKFVSIMSTSEALRPDDGDMGVGVDDDRDVSTGFRHAEVEVCGRTVQVYNAVFSQFNERSSRFFEYEFCSGDGCALLVSRSQFNRGIPCGYSLDPFEVQYHMVVAQLVGNLSPSDREKLADVIRGTVRIVEKRTSSVLTADKVALTSFATSSSRIRSYYLEGKNSIFENLPFPNVTLMNGHAYVSLRDCILDVLGHGLPLDFISFHSLHPLQHNSRYQLMSQTARAHEIWQDSLKVFPEQKSLVLYFNEWSDDFEPTYSIKSNRGSCWIKTVTIAPPPGKVHSLAYTYPIAIGRKDASHECVERRFAEELHELRSGVNSSFYCKAVGGNVNVYADLFVSLQDQPERRSANYIMLGSSKYTARWGIAADFASVASGIPACTSCFQGLLFNVGSSSSQSCLNCVNWSIDVESGLLDTPPPPSFPTCSLLRDNNMIRPFHISYETMRNAVLLTHELVSSGMWSLDNGKAYLYVNGLNSEASKEIILRCNNARLYDKLFKERENDATSYQKILDVKRNFPEMFQIWQFPALWSRGVDLTQHIDVVMHLLFLGVIKSTAKSIDVWLKARGKFDLFIHYMKGVMESVQQLHLGWCKAQPYRGGKFGGWVSENFLCLARLLPWFYSRLDFIAKDPEVYVEPVDKPRHKWTKKENVAWLRQRRLPQKGLAGEVRERVAKYMSQPEGPPAVFQVCGCPVGDVTVVVLSLHAMICTLMAKEISEEVVEDCTRLIKVFLSAFDTFDSSLREGTTRGPKWLTSYNFLCLLNLPDCLRRFGPLSNLWEGGGQGERVLSVVKPLHNGFNKNWHTNILSKAVKLMALSRVVDRPKVNFEVSPTIASWPKLSDALVFTDIHRYKNIVDARLAFRRAQPMSIVQFQSSGTFGIIIYNNSVSFLPVYCDAFLECCVGMDYYIWKMPNIEDVQLSPFGSMVVSRACLLLPRLSERGIRVPFLEASDDYVANAFCLIDSRWSTLQIDGAFKYPALSFEGYL